MPRPHRGPTEVMTATHARAEIKGSGYESPNVPHIARDPVSWHERRVRGGALLSDAARIRSDAHVPRPSRVARWDRLPNGRANRRIRSGTELCDLRRTLVYRSGVYDR